MTTAFAQKYEEGGRGGIVGFKYGSRKREGREEVRGGFNVLLLFAINILSAGDY